jgi:ABC-type multidrug transport system ATPase subunit
LTLGSGKTSLLNILAGRVASNRSVTLSGNISINHELSHPATYKERVAYVTQTDALLSTFTPRESFRFSATLRLRHKTKAEIDVIVDQTLRALGLTLCADTLIGDELIRGISGLFL